MSDIVKTMEKICEIKYQARREARRQALLDAAKRAREIGMRVDDIREQAVCIEIAQAIERMIDHAKGDR